MNKQELLHHLSWIKYTYIHEGGYSSGVINGLGIAITEIKNLDEPEKVVIPQFVADWIEEMKQDERPLYSVMSSLMNKTNHEWAVWKSANKNFSEIVAQAWLDDYEVEKEKLYYVLDKQCKTLLGLVNGKVSLWGGYELHDGNKQVHQLTEKQIKDYDERFWEFAVEVTE